MVHRFNTVRYALRYVQVFIDMYLSPCTSQYSGMMTNIFCKTSEQASTGGRRSRQMPLGCYTHTRKFGLWWDIWTIFSMWQDIKMGITLDCVSSSHWMRCAGRGCLFVCKTLKLCSNIWVQRHGRIKENLVQQPRRPSPKHCSCCPLSWYALGKVPALVQGGQYHTSCKSSAPIDPSLLVSTHHQRPARRECMLALKKEGHWSQYLVRRLHQEMDENTIGWKGSRWKVPGSTASGSPHWNQCLFFQNWKIHVFGYFDLDFFLIRYWKYIFFEVTWPINYIGDISAKKEALSGGTPSTHPSQSDGEKTWAD